MTKRLPAGAGRLRTGRSQACEGQDGFAGVQRRLRQVTTKPHGRRTRRDSASTPVKRSPEEEAGHSDIREIFFGDGRREHTAHEPLIAAVMVEEVPLTGLSF